MFAWPSIYLAVANGPLIETVWYYECGENSAQEPPYIVRSNLQLPAGSGISGAVAQQGHIAPRRLTGLGLISRQCLVKG